MAVLLSILVFDGLPQCIFLMARSGETTFVLEPRSRRVGLLSDSLYFGDSFEQVGGYFRVTANEAVFCFALFGGPHFLAAIEGQVPLN